MSIHNVVKNLRWALLMVLSTMTIVSAHAENPRVALKTDLGIFVIELFPKEAPITVANFLTYVDSKFYDGTIFHRVVPGFVVQGGGMTFDFVRKPTKEAIKNESNNGLRNDYKTVAMARMPNPDSATSQFYINLKNNNALNASEGNPGYTVFGAVAEGMEVVEKIAREPLGMHRAHPEAPNYAVRILNAFRVDKDFRPEPVKTETSNPLKNDNVSDALVKP